MALGRGGHGPRPRDNRLPRERLPSRRADPGSARARSATAATGTARGRRSGPRRRARRTRSTSAAQVCLVQINTGGLTGTRYGLTGKELVGLNRASIEKCFSAGARAFANARGRCAATKTDDWFKKTITSYGTGKACDRRGVGERARRHVREARQDEGHQSRRGRRRRPSASRRPTRTSLSPRLHEAGGRADFPRIVNPRAIRSRIRRVFSVRRFLDAKRNAPETSVHAAPRYLHGHRHALLARRGLRRSPRSTRSSKRKSPAG